MTSSASKYFVYFVFYRSDDGYIDAIAAADVQRAAARLKNSGCILLSDHALWADAKADVERRRAKAGT